MYATSLLWLDVPFKVVCSGGGSRRVEELNGVWMTGARGHVRNSPGTR